MSQDHVKAVAQQFSWVRNILHHLRTDIPGSLEAQVSRADVATLELESYYSVDQEFGFVASKQIFLFDEYGVPLTDLQGKLFVTFRKSWLEVVCNRVAHYTFATEWRTVRRALMELGDQAYRCYFIVHIENSRILTLYRPPKKGTVAGLLKTDSEQRMRKFMKAQSEVGREEQFPDSAFGPQKPASRGLSFCLSFCPWTKFRTSRVKELFLLLRL